MDDKQHMASNQNSLLTRFFALYTVRSKVRATTPPDDPHPTEDANTHTRIPRARPLAQAATHYFVVMENLFPCDLPVHEAYDLKGSMAGRFASEQEVRATIVHQFIHLCWPLTRRCRDAQLMNKEIAVLKDINFQKNRKLVIGREKRQLFFRQLELDCQWLEEHGVMDYSLLLLIHKHAPASATASLPPSPSCPAPATAPPSPSAFSALSALCSPVPPSSTLAPAAASSAAKETGGGKPLYPSLSGGSSPPARDATGGSTTNGGGLRATTTESVFRLNRGGLASMDDFDEEQGEIYFMAIIDMLQPYNWCVPSVDSDTVCPFVVRVCVCVCVQLTHDASFVYVRRRKRLENTYKKLFENEEAISCVDPTKYRYAATQQPATSTIISCGQWCV
jgi:hypothetical protein